MKRFIFYPVFSLLIIVSSFAQEISKDEQVEQYRKEISMLNLVNGLYFTPDQTGAIIPVLKDLKKTQSEYQAAFNSLMPEIKKQYAALHEEVSANKGISKETEKSAGTIHRQELTLKDEYMDKLCTLEQKIQSILTENQLCIIDDFKPCLIPPKNLKDPARVGQAKGDASGVIDHFDRIRKVPDKRFETVKNKFIDGYLDKYEKKIEALTTEKKNLEIKRVNGILNQVRNLTPVDYEMKKEELAQKLLIEPALKNTKKKYELGKVGRFLLNIDLLPILEKRSIAGK